jgi:hypothetical protein
MSRKKGLPFTKPKTRVQTPQPCTNSTDHDKNKTKKTRNTPTYGEMIKDPIHPGNDAPGIHEDCNPNQDPGTHENSTFCLPYPAFLRTV